MASVNAQLQTRYGFSVQQATALTHGMTKATAEDIKRTASLFLRKEIVLPFIKFNF